MVVSLPEGAVANFTVLRIGRADFVATVMYRVEYGEASPGDITLLSNDSLLVFDVGEWMKNISVVLEDDNIPEPDEPFYMVLYNATGEFPVMLHAHAWGVILALGATGHGFESWTIPHFVMFQEPGQKGGDSKSFFQSNKKVYLFVNK